MPKARCTACAHEFRVPSRMAHQDVQCPQCQGDAVVTEAAATDEGPKLSRSSASRAPLPPRADEQRLPRRSTQSTSKRRRQSGPAVNPLVVLGGVGAVVLVGVLFMKRGSGPAAPANNNAPTLAPLPQAEVERPVTWEDQLAFSQAQSQAVARGSDSPVTAPPVTAAAVQPTTPAASGVSAIAPATAATTTVAAPAPAASAVLSTSELVAQVEPSVVRINALNEENELEWHGSGFIVDASGVIATNHHVVAGAYKCVVVFPDKQTFDVRGIYKMSEAQDIALLRADLPSRLRALPLAAQQPEKGERVMAFGCPYGLDFSATDGLISALRTAADVKEMLGAEVAGSWLQTSAPISPGNSGGPLVNLRGEVVGINSMVRTEGQNLNFAISAADVQEMLRTRGDVLTAVSRATGDGSVRKELSRDDVAQRVLAALDNIELRVTNRAEYGKAALTSAVESHARKHIRAAGLGFVATRTLGTPYLKVTIGSEDGVETGTATVSVSCELFVILPAEGDLYVFKAWEKHGEVGTAKKYLLNKSPGEHVNPGLSKFFTELEQEIAAAKKNK